MSTTPPLLLNYNKKSVLKILVFHLFGVIILGFLEVDILRHLPNLKDIILRHRRANPIVIDVPAVGDGGDGTGRDGDRTGGGEVRAFSTSPTRHSMGYDLPREVRVYHMRVHYT